MTIHNWSILNITLKMSPDSKMPPAKSISSRRPRRHPSSPPTSSTYTKNALLLLTAGFLFERGQPINWTLPAILSVAYLSVIGTVVTFGLFFWLLRYAPAHKLSLIAYVTPVIALTLGWSVGQESVTPRTLAGTALVLSGILLVARTRSK